MAPFPRFFVTALLRLKTFAYVCCYWRIVRRKAGNLTSPLVLSRYESIREDDPALRSRIRDIAATRVRYGYRRIHTLLRGEGWHVNHNLVHSVYYEEGLNLRHKRAGGMLLELITMLMVPVFYLVMKEFQINTGWGGKATDALAFINAPMLLTATVVHGELTNRRHRHLD
jgi:hypothetical protein